MSFYRQRDGLFWSSLFSVSGEQKKRILNLIKDSQPGYTSQCLTAKMFEFSGMINVSDYRANDHCMQTACERVALKFMLCDSDFAKDVLNDEELEKANEVYARKQYNSKILKKLLNCFFVLLIHSPDIRAGNLFTIPIIDEFHKVQEDEISSSFGELKKTIEKVAAGIKNNCYYETERCSTFPDKQLNGELNQLMLSKVNYDFNKIFNRWPCKGQSTLLYNDESNINNSILQLALVSDAEFWSKHENFDIVTFLNSIVEHNDVRHAEKVLSFIIENLQKMPNMNIVFKNNFPLYMSKYDALVKSLEDQAFRFSFKRLESYCDLTKLEGVPLCYPMSKADASFFEIGKNVWERFISEYNYPNDYDVVNHYIADEINRFIAGDTHNYDDVAVILDSAPFRYSADSEDRRLFSAYHPDCFSFENIWNRVYLKAYAVTLLAEDDQVQFSYLQRIFVDLIKTIEKRIKICTVHQLDTSTRDKHFLKLKKKLGLYGVEASDENKNNYIVSLLDRDVALLEESALFPMLEQVGDAIYGLAVAELLFYNPDNLFYPPDDYDPEGKNIAERFEKFTRAEAQVLISKKFTADELYLQAGLPSKFTEYGSIFFDYETYNEEQLQELSKEKYLADSLEMIIGAIYVDKGISTALNFSKKLLKETYPEDFSREIHADDRIGQDENIDLDYWPRILPGLYSETSHAHRVLWNALNKVILIYSIGTDDKNKRRYITDSFGNPNIYEEYTSSLSVSWPFYYYLHNGLDFVLQKYRDTLLNNYKKTLNSN